MAETGENKDRKLKVALVYPRSEAITVMPPLGIGYLAAVAEKAGHQVDLYDLDRRHLKQQDFLTLLPRRQYDVIGVSISTPNYESALGLTRQIRKVSPDSTLMIGGPHPSAFLDRSLLEIKPDYLVQREAELVFPQLLDALARKQQPVGAIPGVFALDEEKVTGLPTADYIANLDRIPWPAWEKLEPHRYPPIPHQLFVRRLPVAPILTTRGCPMDCSFCSSGFLFGKTVRTRNPVDVVEELTFLKERFGIREFHFEDDNLTYIRSHAEALFQLIIESNLDVTFKCPNGLMISTLDPEILRLMKQAGCYQISIGIETTVQEARTQERKNLPMPDVRKVIGQIKDVGMEVQGLFVAGLPYDTEEGFKQTVQDAIDMKLDLAHFGVFIPLPGSASGELLAGCDIKTLNFFTPFTGHTLISPKKMKSMQRWALLKFYLRPAPIIKMLSMFKLRQFIGVLRTFRKYVIGW